MNKTGSRHAGFSLIELMISLTIGLIVVGAVLAFAVSTVRANSENIRSARLSQDLRTGMNLVMRELRRSGYDAAAVRRLAQGVSPSSFTAITVSGECVTYGYNRPTLTSIGGAPVATELKGIRRNATTGALEMNTTSSPMSCTGTTNWFEVTDPKVVNITSFSVTPQTTPFCSVVSSSTTTAGTPPVATTTTIIASGNVRNYALALTGQLRSDATIARTMADDVRVRTDAITFATTATVPPALPPTCP
jgi:prepilin-type N-terminal cleavage/methylation domain-containing protein